MSQILQSVRKNIDENSDFLKERLFGLSNPQGNHGESVKEAHFHVDNTPVSQSFPIDQLSRPQLIDEIDCNLFQLPVSLDAANALF